MFVTNMKVLCPLVNVPMIDYTLEFLARNDVKEVFVYCVSHAKQLEDYLQSSKWPAQLEVGLLTLQHNSDAGLVVKRVKWLRPVRRALSPEESFSRRKERI